MLYSNYVNIFVDMFCLTSLAGLQHDKKKVDDAHLFDGHTPFHNSARSSESQHKNNYFYISDSKNF